MLSNFKQELVHSLEQFYNFNYQTKPLQSKHKRVFKDTFGVIFFLFGSFNVSINFKKKNHKYFVNNVSVFHEFEIALSSLEYILHYKENKKKIYIF